MARLYQSLYRRSNPLTTARQRAKLTALRMGANIRGTIAGRLKNPYTRYGKMRTTGQILMVHNPRQALLAQSLKNAGFYKRARTLLKKRTAISDLNSYAKRAMIMSKKFFKRSKYA